jgi:hypothetical protein
MTANVPRTGARNPVLRLRQGYGACALLAAVFILTIIKFTTINVTLIINASIKIENCIIKEANILLSLK